MAKLDEKIDKIFDEVIELKVITIKQEENLREHMRRTELLEEQMKPVSRHVTMVKGVMLFITMLATVAGIYRSLG